MTKREHWFSLVAEQQQSSDTNIARLNNLSADRTYYSSTYGDYVQPSYKEPWGGVDQSNILLEERTLGKKYYELTDHLGNVLATVMDRKTGQLAGGGGFGNLYAYWKADIASAQDYYPFGMMMPGRYKMMNGDTAVYRYGYSGHEKDNEIKGIGNSLNMGARMLDTRLGRTPSPDPAFREYPSISPYAYVGNNPIRFIDPDGKRITDPQGRTAVYIKNGEMIFTKYADKDTRTLIQLMSRTEVGNKVIRDMINVKHNIDLHIDKEKVQYYNPKTGKREDAPSPDNKLMLGAAERYLTKDKQLTRYKVTIYEQSIEQARENNLTFERDGYIVDTKDKSTEDMMGAQTVHEGTHATDKNSQGFRNDIDKTKTEDLPNKNEAEHYKQLEE